MFPPKLGCPLCSIVAAAAPSDEPRSPTTPSAAEVVWRDENVTVYRERTHPVSSKGHLILALNLHVPSIYTLSSSDLPLLVNVRNLATRLLSSIAAPASQPSTPLAPPTTAQQAAFTFSPLPNPDILSQFRIGFIAPPFKDNKIPVTDHLHAHAYIAPGDQLGWWRGIAYGPLAWYAIDDLIAEIRESVSNNRVKSGYVNRKAPIDAVPSAGARSGTANGIEQTDDPLAPDNDIEEGTSPTTLLKVLPSPGGTPSSPTAGSSTSPRPSSSSSSPRHSTSTPLAPQSQIPEIRV